MTAPYSDEGGTCADRPDDAIRFRIRHAFQTFPSQQGPAPRAGPRASQETDHE